MRNFALPLSRKTYDFMNICEIGGGFSILDNNLIRQITRLVNDNLLGALHGNAINVHTRFSCTRSVFHVNVRLPIKWKIMVTFAVTNKMKL